MSDIHVISMNGGIGVGVKGMEVREREREGGGGTRKSRDVMMQRCKDEREREVQHTNLASYIFSIST